ncbi:sulfotransferase [Aureococcus anophagefferens]|nr:sulfotransferase [Aureococcus anophagefferens]
MRHDYSVRCEGWTYACYRAYATLMILVWPLGVPCSTPRSSTAARDIDPPVSVAPTDEAAPRVDDAERGGRRAPRLRPGVGRREAHARRGQARAADPDGREPDVRHLTLLFAPYEPPRWWWEVMEIARRLLSTSFLLLFHGSKTRIFFAVVVSLASIKLYSARAPRRTVDFEALVDDDDDSDSDDDPAPIVVGGVDDAAAGDGVECGACGLFLTPEKAVVDAPEHSGSRRDLEL